jgi:CRP-like cAMP-binding protein
VADAADRLSRVPLFSGLGKRELERLSRVMRERRFAEGETVTSEGQTGVGFFVIEDGTATVSVKGRNVGTLKAGDHFGEIALIDEGPRSATITADADLRCRGLVSWEFRSFVQEHPEVAWPLLRTLASRLRETQDRAPD